MKEITGALFDDVSSNSDKVDADIAVVTSSDPTAVMKQYIHPSNFVPELRTKKEKETNPSKGIREGIVGSCKGVSFLDKIKLMRRSLERQEEKAAEKEKVNELEEERVEEDAKAGIVNDDEGGDLIAVDEVAAESEVAAERLSK